MGARPRAFLEIATPPRTADTRSCYAPRPTRGGSNMSDTSADAEAAELIRRTRALGERLRRIRGNPVYAVGADYEDASQDAALDVFELHRLGKLEGRVPDAYLKKAIERAAIDLLRKRRREVAWDDNAPALRSLPAAVVGVGPLANESQRSRASGQAPPLPADAANAPAEARYAAVLTSFAAVGFDRLRSNPSQHKSLP